MMIKNIKIGFILLSLFLPVGAYADTLLFRENVEGLVGIYRFDSEQKKYSLETETIEFRVKWKGSGPASILNQSTELHTRGSRGKEELGFKRAWLSEKDGEYTWFLEQKVLDMIQDRNQDQDQDQENLQEEKTPHPSENQRFSEFSYSAAIEITQGSWDGFQNRGESIEVFFTSEGEESWRIALEEHYKSQVMRNALILAGQFAGAGGQEFIPIGDPIVLSHSGGRIKISGTRDILQVTQVEPREIILQRDFALKKPKEIAIDHRQFFAQLFHAHFCKFSGHSRYLRRED